MSNTNTGGPAFPTHRVNMHGEVVPDEEGMTLRDYFAAKAMQGWLANSKTDYGVEYETLAAVFFGMADAMLKAREGHYIAADIKVSELNAVADTNPPAREWVGLTDEEIHKMTVLMGINPEWKAEMEIVRSVVRNLEAKLKEKNA